MQRTEKEVWEASLKSKLSYRKRAKDGSPLIGWVKSVMQIRKRYFYHQLPILILNAEAQLHLEYNAKDRLTTSHKHSKQNFGKKKEKEKKSKYR